MKLRSVFYAAVVLFIQNFATRWHILFVDFSIFVGCGNLVRVQAAMRAHYKVEGTACYWDT